MISGPSKHCKCRRRYNLFFRDDDALWHQDYIRPIMNDMVVFAPPPILGTVLFLGNGAEV